MDNFENQAPASEVIKKNHVYRNGKYVEVAYAHQGFPKWKYNAVESAILVNDENEEAELGEGWVDSPGELGIITAPDARELNRRKIEAAKAGSNWKAAMPKAVDVNEHHVAFLQSSGRNDISTIEQAAAFVSSLNQPQQASFLVDAAAWKKPAPKSSEKKA